MNPSSVKSGNSSGALDGRMRILMDVEKLMAGADLGLVDKARNQPERAR